MSRIPGWAKSVIIALGFPVVLMIVLRTGSWWPGIMFWCGFGVFAHGLDKGRDYVHFQFGLWYVGIGVWALASYSILVFFGLVALSGLVAAFFRPPAFAHKPEPDPALSDGL